MWCYSYGFYFFLNYIFENLKQNCFHIVLFSIGFQMRILLVVEIPDSHRGVSLSASNVRLRLYLQVELCLKDVSWFRIKSLVWAVLYLPLPVPWVSKPVFTIISWFKILLSSLTYEFNSLSPHSVSLDFSKMIFQLWPRMGSPFFWSNSQSSGKNFSSSFWVLSFTSTRNAPIASHATRPANFPPTPNCLLSD